MWSKNKFKVFPPELFLDCDRIVCEKKIASGAFGTIYKGSFLRSSGQSYQIALKTIRIDVENGREKDRDRLDLLKVTRVNTEMWKWSSR